MDAIKVPRPQIGADAEGLCLCREPGQQQGGGNITGDLRSRTATRTSRPVRNSCSQPEKGRNAPQIANEDEKNGQHSGCGEDRFLLNELFE